MGGQILPQSNYKLFLLDLVPFLQVLYLYHRNTWHSKHASFFFLISCKIYFKNNLCDSPSFNSLNNYFYWLTIHYF